MSRIFSFSRRWFSVAFLFATTLPALLVDAGGSGLTTLVVVNSASPDSLALVNHYVERRAVPSGNVLRIHWPGSAVQWSLTEFSNVLWQPLTNAIALRGLSNQIDRVVLTLSIPYRVTSPTEGANSTTSVLLYGFKGDTRDPFTCPLATNSVNSFAGTESSFALNPATSSAGPSFLATLLTAGSLTQALASVDAAVASDETSPTNRIVLAKTTAIANSVRHVLFDNVVLNANVGQTANIVRTNSNATTGFGPIAGFQTGLANFTVPAGNLAPGALADSLTSFGGYLFDPLGQTTALEFIHAGAAGSYGTITEPCNYLEKFPSPMAYFHQSRGFSLAECYALNLTNPYQGLIVGEALAARFARAATISWPSPPNNPLVGTTNLALAWIAADTTRPVARIDLFVDGVFHSTVTNLAPTQGNIVRTILNGRTMNYTVPANATLASVAAGVTSLLNQFMNQIATKVTATAHGDRIELQSTDASKMGTQLTASVTNLINGGSTLHTRARMVRPDFLDSGAFGYREFLFGGVANAGAMISVAVTKTNSSVVSVGVTNASGAPVDLGTFVASFVNALNASAPLQQPDGCVAEDFTTSGGVPRFFLRARTAGWPASAVRANFDVSGGVSISEAGSVRLDENVGDLRPRNHLYIASGATNGGVAFALDTTALADGHHVLEAVAYEGTHVRTQARAAIPITIENTPLTAAMTVSNLDFTSATEGMFTIRIDASGASIAGIELFSQGGSVGVVSNAPTAVFNLAGSQFGAGRVPFHAIVTDTLGRRYRTAEFNTRFVGLESSIETAISGPAPLQLEWPGIAGRTYGILAATNLVDPFALVESLIAPHSTNLFWVDTNAAMSLRRFYRIQASE